MNNHFGKTEMKRIAPHIRDYAEKVGAQNGVTASKAIDRFIELGIEQYESARNLLQPKR
jgi:hypothetical protein